MHGYEGQGSFEEVRDFLLQFLASYGWIITATIASLYLVKSRLLPWLRPPPVESPTSPDPQLLEKQQEARRRLQEQQDSAAAIHRSKEKEREVERIRQRTEERQRTSGRDGQRLGSLPSNSETTKKTEKISKKNERV